MKYEKYKVRRGKFKGQWRFRLLGDNGEPLIPPESYFNEADMLATIELIKDSKDAPVVEVEK